MVLVSSLLAKRVLVRAGGFIVPSTSTTADAMILEGGESIDRRLLLQATKQICSGRAKRLFLVMHEIPGQPRAEAEYNAAAKTAANDFGLCSELDIIRTPDTHPITLKEASAVLKELSRQGIHSAIFMTDGFHERRSYLVYKQTGVPLGIRIAPSGVFLTYTVDNWWSKRAGIYEFFEELAKTTYYYLEGFLLIASLNHPAQLA